MASCTVQQRTALNGRFKTAPPSKRDRTCGQNTQAHQQKIRELQASARCRKNEAQNAATRRWTAPRTDVSRTAFGLPRSGPENLLLSGVLSATDTGKHRTTETAPDSAGLGVENCCCHAKSWPWGVVSLRARGTGYMRLRMGCFVGEGAAQGGVRWEASDARCFAFGKRGAECGEACKMVTMVAVKRKETGEVAVWGAMNH